MRCVIRVTVAAGRAVLPCRAMELAARLQDAVQQAPAAPAARLRAAVQVYLDAVESGGASPEDPALRVVVEDLLVEQLPARGARREERVRTALSLWAHLVGAARLGMSGGLGPEVTRTVALAAVEAVVGPTSAQPAPASATARPNPPPELPTRGDPRPFDYTSYRDYLRDWFAARDGRPSQRGFANKVNLSASFLTTVLQGERDLNAWDAERVADQLGLDERGRGYFLDMVEYNQPGSAARRALAFDRMTATRRFLGAARPVDHAWALFRQWYVPAVAELVRCEGFVEDPAWIAATLRPPIQPEEAERALETLLAIGMLVRDESGRLRQANPVMATDHEVARAQGVGLGAWHLWMLERAAEVLDTLPPSERHFGGLTAAVSPELLAELKDRLSRFAEEVVARCENHPGPADRVVQIAFQLMPLSAVTGS